MNNFQILFLPLWCFYPPFQCVPYEVIVLWQHIKSSDFQCVLHFQLGKRSLQLFLNHDNLIKCLSFGTIKISHSYRSGESRICISLTLEQIYIKQSNGFLHTTLFQGCYHKPAVTFKWNCGPNLSFSWSSCNALTGLLLLVGQQMKHKFCSSLYMFASFVKRLWHDPNESSILLAKPWPLIHLFQKSNTLPL
jgi:hypothetical protein